MLGTKPYKTHKASCGQKLEFLIIEHGGTYSHYWVLKS